MHTIPVHQLQLKTQLGFELKSFGPGTTTREQSNALGPHRDDHYIFFLLTGGAGSLIVDFHDRHLGAGELLYILPTQVHYRISASNARGWFIAVDPSLVDTDSQEIFEQGSHVQQPCSLSASQLTRFDSLLHLLGEYAKEEITNNAFVKPAHLLVQTFVAMAAEACRDKAGSDKIMSRMATLSGQFKKLLPGNIRSLKSPSGYAEKLNVSESYLNESVKKTTGSPVNYWIQQEVLMEARRLLCYSELSVKEIAAELGYSSHSYFCRFFRKAAGMTALEFRRGYKG
jgi:AraC family transcriptional activator of pobA